MAVVTNPSYETPGADYGQADSWTETYTSTGEDVAQFFHHADTRQPVDGFEDSWSDNHYYQTGFATADIVSAFFAGGAAQYEGFEGNWDLPAHLGGPVGADNAAAVFSYVASNFIAAVFTSTLAYENFESGWGVSPYNEGYDADGFDAAADARLTAAVYTTAGAPTVEEFEADWQSNDTYDADGFEMNGAEARLTKAIFAGGVGPKLYEDFEDSWTSTFP